MLKPIKHVLEPFRACENQAADLGCLSKQVNKSYDEQETVIQDLLLTTVQDLLLLVKNELRQKDGSVNRLTERKLANAFLASPNPRALADAITHLGKSEHIHLLYDRAILFYSYHNAKGGPYQGTGTLFTYNGPIPEGKRLGINGRQIKPLADTIREATTLDCGTRNENLLLEKEKFMNGIFAKTGDPQGLVDRLNRQIAKEDKPGNRHELFYVHELGIRIDYTRPPRYGVTSVISPRLQIVDAERTFFCTVSLK